MVQYSTLGLVLVGLFQVRHGFVMLPERVLARLPDDAVPRFLDPAPLSEYSFLSTFVERGQVVMADRNTSLEAPAFGARVVGIAAPEAFVDTTQRNADVSRFHDPASSEQDRREIAARYDVSFLLVDRALVDRAPEAHRSLLALGPVSYSNDRFILIDLRAPTGTPRV